MMHYVVNLLIIDNLLTSYSLVVTKMRGMKRCSIVMIVLLEIQ